jgi:hypothetical protein
MLSFQIKDMEFTGVMYLIIAIEVGSDVFQQVMMQDLA